MGPERNLFQPIEQLGDPEKSPEAKRNVICRAEDILACLGLEPALVGEIAELREQTEPLTTLVLARKPLETERLRLEGRGAYHKHILFNREVIVYVKGTGNESAFNQASSAFPGFPSESDKLFFDDLFLQHHPRMLGTETLGWGLLELINSSVLFAQLADKYRWKSVIEAIDAGVTIPLSVTHYKELSSHLQSLLEKAINNTEDTLDKEAMQWPGNFIGLGSVAQIVPSSRRLAREGDQTSDKEALEQRITDPHVIETSGRTLRELFDAGYVYSEFSSHGQNLYDSGLVAQADNSDLVFLGDYKTAAGYRRGEAEYPWDEEYQYRWDDPTVPIPASLKRTVVMFNQLEQQNLLTPLYYPLPEEHISWDTIKTIQEKFWGEILKERAHKDAIPVVARLIPYMRTEINLAASQMLIENADQQRWDEIATRKEWIMQRYEALSVSDEYEKKKRHNLSKSQQWAMLVVLEKDHLPVKAWKSFLQSGNMQDLLQDPRTANMVELAQAIESIQDEAEKEALVQVCAHFFGMRDAWGMSTKPDQIAYFDGAHSKLIINLIAQGRIEDAKKGMKTLCLSTTRGFGWSFCSWGGEERIEFAYPRLLLSTDNINDLYEQCRFDYLLDFYRKKANPYSLTKLFRDVMNGSVDKVPEEAYDVSVYAKERELQPPTEIIRSVLAKAYIHDEPHRMRITSWLEEYMTLQKQLEESDYPHPHPEEIIAKLDKMAASIQTTYPELAFGHHCGMVAYYKGINQAKAAAYFSDVVAYYQNNYSARQDWLVAKTEARGAPEPTQKNLEAMYRALGFPLIARHLANRSYLDDVW